MFRLIEIWRTEASGHMKQRITATIDGVARWYDHLRFEREVFNASLAGVDHTFPERYPTLEAAERS